MTVTVLERPVYGMSQVDRLLGLHGGTARRWIDGYDRAGKHYPPVIRPATTGAETVTWGEFVEARLLAGYRSKGVPLVRMRPVVEELREELGTPYPLAHAKLFTDGRELLAKVQKDVGLESPLQLVVVRTGQMVLADDAERFFDAVDWQEDGDRVALRVLPLGSRSAVALDPNRSFGSPAVGNIRTDIIAEEFRAGESPDSIARSFGVSREAVDDALRFELLMRAA